MEQTKKCTKCGEVKPLSAYYANSRTRDGRRSECVVCNSNTFEALRREYPEKVLAYQRRRHQKNPEKNAEYAKKWRDTKGRSYVRRKMAEDPTFRAIANIRSRVNAAIRNNSKSSSTVTLLGCSIEELRNHLASLFTSGMSWDNYGEWHIDHIIPCCSFDMSDAEQQKKCFHYTNLQPLWAKDNLKKGSKIPHGNDAGAE